MDEDTEYLQLPLEDRCVHKLWKARVNGYEECRKHFPKITDEKSSEFVKFAPLMKKFAIDSNAVAQEKALDAVLAFLENAHPNISGRTAADVTAGIVAKCLSAPKKSTQDKALEVVLMYCEVEKFEPVQEELIKGFAQKNPKVVCGCVKVIATALREFGSKVISIKLLVKSMGPLLEHRDKNVREEAKKMVIEMYRWVGAALNSQLTSLKPIQVQELEAEFEKMPKDRATPSRLLRSQQNKQKVTEADEGADEVDEGEVVDVPDEVDPLDFVTAVNILEKLPNDFFEKVESKKWQERKEALEALLPLSQSPKLESGDYAELLKALKKIISKDSNVMVVALSGQCMGHLARGLNKRFYPYALPCLEAVLEKFKEKKSNVTNALREASDSIFQSTNVESIHEICCASLNSKNPNVKAETVTFLARSFCYCTPESFGGKKVLKAICADLMKTLNESDATVRENSAEALGVLIKVMGEKALTPFIADVDQIKKQKIMEYCEKAEIKVKSKPKPSKPKVTKPPQKKVEPKVLPKKPAAAKIIKPRVVEPVDDMAFNGDNDFGDDAVGEVAVADDGTGRVDITEQLTETLLEELADKNWKVRLEALGKVSALLNPASGAGICGTLGDMPRALSARVGDTNKKLAAEALKVAAHLAVALGAAQCRVHARTVVPAVLAALGDTKKAMRDLALETLNAWVDELGSTREVIDGEMCIDALTTGSTLLKADLLAWMADKLKDAPPKSQNKEELNGCVSFVLSGLEDRSADVRKASADALLPFMLHLGYDAMTRHAAKLKPSSKNTVSQALDKAKLQLPARPAPAKAPSKVVRPGLGQRSNSGLDRPPSAKTGVVRKNPAQARPQTGLGRRAGSGLGATRKDEEETTSGPLLAANRMKQTRVSEEQRMRTLRWDFATPRPEFVSQLREQMSVGAVKTSLVEQMFHHDFRAHIKAIDALAEDLSMDVDATIANLDLILRWLTLRFFDTNPSVLLKAIDYLGNVFETLAAHKYDMIDYEAYSFLPFLVMKFGDPKDAIRGPTKTIMRLIGQIYPPSKMAPYVLDGLKSKNARQRAECLDLIGTLIELSGVAVCQPNPSSALKEVAKQIGDRDNAVRNAALNCLLQVYYREGEKVYKLIGSLSDKNLSLLEERIKRSAKRPARKIPDAAPAAQSMGAGAARPNRVIPTLAAQPPPTLRDNRPNNENAATPLRRYGVGLPRPLSAAAAPSDSKGSASGRSGGLFQIDLDNLERLLDDSPTQVTKEADYHLEEIPDIDAVMRYDVPHIPIKTPSASGFASAMRANIANANVDLQDAAQAINLVISQVASTETNSVICALSQLDEVIESSTRRPLLSQHHVDQLLVVARFQYRHVLTTKMTNHVITGGVKMPDECIRIYRSLTSCLTSLFSHKEVASKASRDVLRDMVETVITLLLDNRLQKAAEDGDEDSARLVRALNVLVVRMIEKAHFTNIFSALLQLLQASVSGSDSSSTRLELVLKCNWKAIRILPSRKPQLDASRILQDAHDFMQAFPSNTWASRESDMPLKTVKTTLHTLVKELGQEILEALNDVPGSKGSEVHKYILRDLNSCQQRSASSVDSEPTKDVSSGNALAAKSPRKFNKAANSTLSEIFKKIGSKENTKEGLVHLYDFKLAHPDADVDSYLRKSSNFFQNYIERGLAKVEMERGDNKRSSAGDIKKEEEAEMAIKGVKEAVDAGAPLSCIQVPGDAGSAPVVGGVPLDAMMDQFRAMATRAGFDDTYISDAINNILSDTNS